MTHPEVQFVLDTIKDNWGTVGTTTVGSTSVGDSIADANLERVDRDTSDLLEQPVRSKTADLQDANYVGATLANRDTTPIGTEYDHDIETTVGVRVEGLAAREYGHVDEDGEDGVVWRELIREITRTILVERVYPQVDRNGTTYTDLRIGNQAPQSDNYDDYYRYDFDILFNGYEELP